MSDCSPASLTPDVLTIGVTGHRLERLGASHLPDIAHAVQTTLAAIAAIAQQHGAQTHVVTSLDDGGDSIVARAALAQNLPLMSVLPFSREDYAGDFADPALRQEYERLLGRSHTVFELPGDDTSRAQGIAYERAGRVVLAQCDVLLAIWDGGPALGRGGTAQLVAAAVWADVPVLQIDPSGATPPGLLWDGLSHHDLGQQTVDTVVREGLDALPAVIAAVLAAPLADGDRALRAEFDRIAPPRRPVAFAYPLLLAVAGVRRLRWADLAVPDAAVAGAVVAGCCAPIAARSPDFGARLRDVLVARFARADMTASSMAQVFRSGYVANFALSALAVLLTLTSLALPLAAKPVLVTLELLTIGAVLVMTRAGNARDWHHRWLDNRHLAECLRCLALSAQLGDISLHRAANVAMSPLWVRQVLRNTGQAVGLPDARVDAAWLGDVRDGLTRMIAAQLAYLRAEHRRIHRLEHRLHRLGTALFALTALICVMALGAEAAMHLTGVELSAPAMHDFVVVVTMATAGLPALGAAIYGIRMQGEFAEVAARAGELEARLHVLADVVADDALRFDTLQRRIAHLTELLTSDLAQWHQTYRARPLALPG